MSNKQKMQYVDPNKFKVFKQFNEVRAKDYICDPDGKEYAVVLGWNNQYELVCRIVDDPNKRFKLSEDDISKLGITFKRFNGISPKKDDIPSEANAQISECLRIAGVLNESDDNYYDITDNAFDPWREDMEKKYELSQKNNTAEIPSDNKPNRWVFKENDELQKMVNKNQLQQNDIIVHVHPDGSIAPIYRIIEVRDMGNEYYVYNHILSDMDVISKNLLLHVIDVKKFRLVRSNF